MEKITGTLVQGHLGNILEQYRRISASSQVVQGFEHFSTEAIIFAKLEWSNYLRDTYSEKDRLKYLYEKCFEYDSPNIRIPIVEVNVDDYYGYILLTITQHKEVVKESEHDHPF